MGAVAKKLAPAPADHADPKALALIPLSLEALAKLMEDAAARGAARVLEQLHQDDDLLPTDKAYAVLGLSNAKSLRELVAAGKIVPDVWGGRGKGKQHLFSRATLRRFKDTP